MSNPTAVERIAVWIEKAKEVEAPAHVPELPLLVGALDGSPFFIGAAVGQGDDGRPRIVFNTHAPKGAELKRRMMQPVHAAIGRIIELAGGGINTHQPDPEANYQYRVRLNGLPTTNLPRILFGVGQSRDLKEIKGANYHDITPASFVLRIGPDRAAVLEVVGRRDPQLADLLRGLFELADKWHGSELKLTH